MALISREFLPEVSASRRRSGRHEVNSLAVAVNSLYTSITEGLGSIGAAGQ